MTLGARPASKGFPRGPTSILATIAKFPKTTHPLSDASKFVVDGWVINNGIVEATLGSSDRSAAPVKPDALLFITVQGEFAEHPSLGVRSFSRCFVVAPVPADSPASNLGWPCVIISDQLTVRQYAGSDAWKTDGVASSAPAPPQPSNKPAPVNGSLNLDSLPPHLKNITPAQGLVSQIRS
jgi:nuclear RNA export factor